MTSLITVSVAVLRFLYLGICSPPKHILLLHTGWRAWGRLFLIVANSPRPPFGEQMPPFGSVKILIQTARFYIKEVMASLRSDIRAVSIGLPAQFGLDFPRSLNRITYAICIVFSAQFNWNTQTKAGTHFY